MAPYSATEDGKWDAGLPLRGSIVAGLLAPARPPSWQRTEALPISAHRHFGSPTFSSLGWRVGEAVPLGPFGQGTIDKDDAGHAAMLGQLGKPGVPLRRRLDQDGLLRVLGLALGHSPQRR